MDDKKIREFIKAATSDHDGDDYAKTDAVLTDIIADKIKERYDTAYDAITSKLEDNG